MKPAKMGPQTEDKRLSETDGSNLKSGSSKRQKTEDNGASTDKMDSKELASAFALASLASFSPGTKNGKPIRSANMMLTQSNASFETRSPKSEPIPISPELRSPVRSVKRVHFASNVKHDQAPSPAPRRFGFAPPVSPHSFPIRMQAHSFGAFPPRHQQPPPNWGMPTGMMQRPIPPPVRPVTQQWICDFCNSAAFNTFEEACMHEEACRLHCGGNGTDVQQMMFHSIPDVHGTHGMSFDGETDASKIPAMASDGATWFSGSVSLSIPESDSEWLSQLNCFIRKFCIEAFSATEEDVASTSKRGRISLHQVGIRCCYCKHRPLKERAVAAVSYPTSVAGIYESVKRWQRVHIENCEDVPSDVTSNIAEIQNTNVSVPTTRQYWTDSARALGMVDTEAGIRFSCDPKCLREATKIEFRSAEPANTSGSISGAISNGQGLVDGELIVYPEDIRVVPPYVYFLMSQVESCHFSEVDRFVARSKGPVGYPGFQCRHCKGHAGLGKYFPVSAKTLSTNSTSQNIHAHLLKCRKCPEHVKEKLVALKVEKGRSPRLEPGWRKIFFDKVWARLHG